MKSYYNRSPQVSKWGKKRGGRREEELGVIVVVGGKSSGTENGRN